MHPALIATHQVLTEHTGSIVQLLQQRSELGHARDLARMLQQVISQTTESITEKQIEAILTLTQQTHKVYAKNLDHYMAEQEKFNGQYRATTDPFLRAELTGHITNIDDQMKAIRRDMEALHRFSAQIINICGEAGLRFVKDLSMPYTELRRIG